MRKLTELESLKVENARLELAVIKTEQALNNTQAELLALRETVQKEKNKKVLDSLNLGDGKVTLKRNPDGIYEVAENSPNQ